mmetsp:Transcript_37099/g.74256  ORF Transcript_37099/g.74256 Transcript_37099/m.74256 type:complete len:257 (-) Transcript_37099:65-835(-)
MVFFMPSIIPSSVPRSATGGILPARPSFAVSVPMKRTRPVPSGRSPRSKLQSRKCARWLVPTASSKPSTVRRGSLSIGYHTAALHTRASTRRPISRRLLTKSRTLSNDARSRFMMVKEFGSMFISLAARTALEYDRTAMMTCQPFSFARAAAACKPIPLDAPVTITVGLPSSFCNGSSLSKGKGRAISASFSFSTSSFKVGVSNSTLGSIVAAILTRLWVHECWWPQALPVDRVRRAANWPTNARPEGRKHSNAHT